MTSRSNCSKTAGAKTLSALSKGAKAVVVLLEHPDRERSRLMSLGLYPGALVSVVSRSAQGPLVLAVGAARLLLGLETANGILVV